MRGYADRVVRIGSFHGPRSNRIVIVHLRRGFRPRTDAAFGRGNPPRHEGERFRGTRRTDVRVVYLLAVQAEPCRPQLHGSSLDPVVRDPVVRDPVVRDPD